MGDINETNFLDLFAGTGNIGIEAISRGCSSVYFVESSSIHCNIIKENLILTGFEKKGKVIRKMVKKGLFKVFKENGFHFDIIFADPPYEVGIVQKILDTIDFDILADGGIYVLQHSIRENAGNKAKKEVRIGDTLLSFYGRKDL